ncbi:hypothetical protein O3M35_012189 [Rhynocoris fuscipes]|uniref:Uncharacterized protein n=1 Tax=Rhynocoris fuscipes TaxID=488301 RepID=A0AAW1CYX5_9HEMI
MNIPSVFLSVILSVTSAQYWHHGIQDTPEVAAAKADHFAAVEKARLSKATEHLTGLYKKPVKKYRSNEHYIETNPDYELLYRQEAGADQAKHLGLLARSSVSSFQQHNRRYDSDYQSKDRIDLLSRSKRLADHQGFGQEFAAFNYFQHPGVQFGIHDAFNKYHGPIALPPGYDKNGAPLPVLDTPEVAEEKAKHLALVAKKRAWYDEHSAFGGDSHLLGGNDDFIGSQHGALSSFHDGGFSSGVGFHAGFKPSLNHFGGGEFSGPLAFSGGFDKHAGQFSVVDTHEGDGGKPHQFAAFAKIAADHQLGRGQKFSEHF